MTVWSLPGAALPAGLHRRLHGHPRARCASSPQTSVAGSGASCRSSRRFIAVLAARHTGRPCNAETRSESLVSAHHGRDQWRRRDARGDPGGKGHRAQGGPARRHGRLPRARHSVRADARRPHVQRHLHVPRLPLPLHQRPTNKTWTDAYRGAGRPEATFAIERLMDELRRELGVDPMEVRRKNWITRAVPVPDGGRGDL